jgi:NAD(P)-dependent dehydrogenase (short-subunit alcohol dehydrogenase family)
MRFENKVALVTGAGKGIGAAVAKRLASEGAKLVCADRDEAALVETLTEIRAAGGTAESCAVDVAVAADVEALVRRCVELFGGLHLAVNNAGISCAPNPAADQDLEAWNAVIAVNLSGVFYGLKYQIPEILRSGGGAIVNVSSMYARHGLPGHAPYSAAKYGVVGLSRVAALDYADQAIRINTVCPGVIDTPMARSGGDQTDAIASMIPLRRLGQGRDVAAVIAFLLSDDASYVTASEYDVDGGILH